MPRPRRYVTKGGALVETCSRIMQRRFLQRPDDDYLEILFGVLGRALEYAGVELCGFQCLSNHYHALYWVENALQMATFQWYLNDNLAKETARMRDWHDKVWARRYRPMIISDEEDAQWDCLKYVLANGTKEGLVASPYDWPGPNMAKALVHGGTLDGTWFNRTEEYAATRRGEPFEKYDYATKYQIGFQQLPASRHLSPEEYSARVAGLVLEIEQEGAARREKPVLGVKRILLQSPYDRPAPSKKNPAPMLFYADTPQEWAALADDHEAFEAQYEVAKGLLFLATGRSGPQNPSRYFPDGCFPPAMPFVGATMPSRPLPPTRSLEVLELGKETVVVRGPIPVISVPRRVGVPGREAVGRASSTRTRAGPARASPGA